MKRLLETLKNLPTPQLVFLGAGILVVLALVGSGVGTWVSHYKDKKFDKEIQTLKTERQAAIDKANQAEERAKALEADKIKFQLALEVAEKQGAKAQERIADAKAKYDETLANIDVDIPPCQRYNIARTSLGLKAVECSE